MVNDVSTEIKSYRITSIHGFFWISPCRLVNWIQHGSNGRRYHQLENVEMLYMGYILVHHHVFFVEMIILTKQNTLLLTDITKTMISSSHALHVSLLMLLHFTPTQQRSQEASFLFWQVIEMFCQLALNRWEVNETFLRPVLPMWLAVWSFVLKKLASCFFSHFVVNFFFSVDTKEKRWNY